MDITLKGLEQLRGRSQSLIKITGRLTGQTGPVLRAVLPEARTGDLVRIGQREPYLLAEVIGFNQNEVILLALDHPMGLSPGTVVRPLNHQLKIPCGSGVLGRILDGLGRPMDKGSFSHDITYNSVHGQAPHPLERTPVTRCMETGIKVIDGLLTLGYGQRIGLFSGPGVGKSSLLGQIAKQAKADMVVICLVGERGREVRPFIENIIGDRLLEHSVVVCATSDQPAIVRLNSLFTATTIAEHFRDQSADVLLLVDSLTRFARAQREVGLAAGEPPVRQGYPPSLFSVLPAVIERTGTSETGTITAIYSLLITGDDINDPLSDEIRGLLDGHIHLDRRLAQRGFWPAVDIPSSISRVMTEVADKEHCAASARFRRLLGTFLENRDRIALGAYRKGQNQELDRAIEIEESMNNFLRQENHKAVSLDKTKQVLYSLLEK